MLHSKLLSKIQEFLESELKQKTQVAHTSMRSLDRSDLKDHPILDDAQQKILVDRCNGLSDDIQAICTRRDIPDFFLCSFRGKCVYIIVMPIKTSVLLNDGVVYDGKPVLAISPQAPLAKDLLAAKLSGRNSILARQVSDIVCL